MLINVKTFISKYMIVLVLIGLVTLSGIISPAFLKPRNILNIFWQTSYMGIIAIGITFVMIAGGIDLSVGSQLALLGAFAVVISNKLSDQLHSTFVVISLTYIIAALLGLSMGFLITKGRIPAFIATLGGMAIYRSLVLHFANGGVYVSFSRSFSGLGMKFIVGLPLPMLIFVIYAIIMHVMLEKTKFGRYVFAVGANELAAIYSAVNINFVRITTYVISSISVATSAVLLSSMMGSVSSSSTGVGFELDAIAAAVIGGTSLSGGKGSIFGTFFGALILGVINNMLVMLNVAVYLQSLVKGLIIIIAVLLQNINVSKS